MPEKEISLTNIDKSKLLLGSIIRGLSSYVPGLSILVDDYFSQIDEIRLKRIENEIECLKENVEQLGQKLAGYRPEDCFATFTIIEMVHEEIQKEPLQEKQKYLINYLKNTMNNPPKEEEFDERRFFLDALSTMTVLDCQVLKHAYCSGRTMMVKQVIYQFKDTVDEFAVMGAIGRHTSFGFIMTRSIATIGSGLNTAEYNNIMISSFGIKFYDFCLNIST